MDSEALRAYLHNLAIVARADSHLAEQEKVFLRRILAELNVDDALWDDVIDRIAPKASIDLQPLPRLSIRVRCLEDMLELALVDGAFDSAEKRVLFEAARRAGLTDALAKQLMAEAKARIEAYRSD